MFEEKRTVGYKRNEILQMSVGDYGKEIYRRVTPCTTPVFMGKG